MSIIGDNLDNYLEGGSVNDTILGLGGDDQIYGEGGNDSVEGGDGADDISGGSGDDTLWGNSEAENGFEMGDTNDGRDTIHGGNGDDLIYGNQADDELYGGNGDDTIFGGRENDILYGGGGVDDLIGGEGDDLIIHDEFDSSDSYDGGIGTDTLRLDGYSFQLLNLSALSSIEVIDFSGTSLEGNNNANTLDLSGILAFENEGRIRLEGGNDTFLGSILGEEVEGGTGNDTILGNGGNDTISGGTGDDVLDGGEGDDLFIQDDQFSQDVYSGGSGTDTVRLETYEVNFLDLSASVSVEVLDFQGSDLELGTDASSVDLSGVQIFVNDGAIDLQGGNDVFVGSLVGEEVLGGNGNDTISGNGGNDTINGGGGVDQLDGGDGDDVFLQGYWDSSDIFFGGSGHDTLRLSGYTFVSLDLSVGASVEVIDFDGENLEGTNNSDVIDISGVEEFEDEGDIFLEGGNDTFKGSKTDDVVEAGSGNDGIRGRSGDDKLLGQSGDDKIKGGKGKDTLDDGSGTDKLTGGGGSDEFHIGIDNEKDRITDFDITKGCSGVLRSFFFRRAEDQRLGERKFAVQVRR